MENASKALIMAGGVLLVMLIIAILIFSWGKFSDFYNGEDEIVNTKDVTEFNLQFTTYDRKNVYGYELISLANKIADYNDRYSTANVDITAGYNPITLKVILPNNDSVKKLWFDESYTDHLFPLGGKTYTQSTTQNEIIGNIVTTANGIAKAYGDESTANKLAKSIKSILLKGEQGGRYEEIALEDYKRIVKNDAEYKVNTYAEMLDKIKNKASMYKYYEFNQFKKAMFDSQGIIYDQITGRVSQLSFVYNGSIE